LTRYVEYTQHDVVTTMILYRAQVVETIFIFTDFENANNTECGNYTHKPGPSTGHPVQKYLMIG